MDLYLSSLSENHVELKKLENYFKTKLIIRKRDKFLKTKINYKKNYKEISNYLTNFINKYNVNKINLVSFDKFSKIFLDIFNKAYLYYENYLEENNLMDFDSMILLATKNADIYRNKYDYIIVDEYQDISSERFSLLLRMVKNTNTSLVVVGDDWQSIFAFAGSKINLFLEFKNIMNATVLKIETTYRFSNELNSVASSFIMKNVDQIKKDMKSFKNMEYPVVIKYYFEDIKIDKIVELDKIIRNIVKKTTNILLLGRFNKDIYEYLDKHYFCFINNRLYSVKNKIYVDFLTVHSAKGLGYDEVIIINGKSGEYGFPSNKKSDSVYKMLNINDNLVNEERRLFYVALTRTKNHVYILAPYINCSPFIKEIKGNKFVKST
jgi:DNA helicase-4